MHFLPRLTLAAFALVTLLSACGESQPRTGTGSSPETPVVIEPVARYSGIAPDASLPGLFAASEPREYDLGQYLVSDGDNSLAYNVDVHGQVRAPTTGSGPFPVILYLHGRHVTCSYGGFEFLSAGICPEINGLVLEIKPVPSYVGYDYMAAHLASAGYVVISIDANDINDKDLTGDQGVQARAQLLLHHLDVFRQINLAGGEGFDDLKGRMDFSRVGLMGHSRGGQGVAHAVRFNQARVNVLPMLPGDPEGFTAPHQIKAVFALAPTDFDRHTTPGVAFATLLPYCDGDVSNLQGAWMFDDNRSLDGNDSGPQFQIVARGTNHNFYNTIWIDDDYGSDDPYCGTASATTGRDLPEDQRRHGEFLMSAFFRAFVGGEPAFASYWQGTARAPDAACPKGSGPCDARLLLSTQPGSQNRWLIDAFASAESLTSNTLGLATTLQGFAAPSVCTSAQDGSGCGSARTYSVASQLQLAWDAPNASYQTLLGGLDASRYDTLNLRAGLVVGNARNAGGQQLLAVLSDSAGHSAEVDASRFTDALFDPPGNPDASNGAKTTLNGVAIPLAAFTGVDLQHLQSLTLRFPHAGGALQLTDLMLQKR